MPVIQPQIKPLLMQKAVDIVLFAYLNYYAYIVFVMVFTLVGRFTPLSNLFVCL